MNNLPIRPAGSAIAVPPMLRIKEIKKILGSNVEIVSPSKIAKQSTHLITNFEKAIVRFLKVRPAQLDDLEKSLSLNSNEILKYLTTLLDKKVIRIVSYKNKRYFLIND